VTMRDEIGKTLDALELDTVYSAAAELALTYARQLDQAAAVRAQADKALRTAYETGDEAMVEQVTALRAKLSERDCVDRIGRDMAALLDQLHATPKARAAVDKDKAKGHGGRQAPPSSGALARLRSVQ